MDYRLEGPEEAQAIAKSGPMCQTAPNATGKKCQCSFDCVNYKLRAAGFKAEE
jgi:hypothetical protein